MSVIFPRKLIFLDHPRTGGTSVQFGMAKIGGMTHKRHTLVTANVPIVCCTVRNPFDLLVSWYVIINERKQFDGDFLSFIQTYDNYNFTRGGRLFYFVQFCNTILRFENLQADLSKVLRQAKLPPLKLKHENKTIGKKPYKKYYNEAAIAAMKKRFKIDIEEFGYEA